MKTYLYLILIGLFPLSGRSQIALGIHLQYDRPISELKSEGYRNGIGLNLDVMYGEFEMRIPAVFQLGLQGEINFHGSESVDIQLATGESADITIRNLHGGIFGAFRILSPYAPVRVYADGLIGTRVFFSQDVFRVEGADEPDIEGVANAFAFSYGGALGFLIKINEEVSIDGRVKYTKGSWIRYVDLETVELQNDEVIYDFQRSMTDLIIFQLGVNIWITEL